MKISHLIVCLLVLALGIVGVMYSMHQNTTMSMLIRAHGGSEAAQLQGLRQTVSELKSKGLEAANARKDALTKQNKSLLDMKDARNEYKDAEAVRDAAQAALDATIGEIKTAEAELQRLTEESEKMLEFFSSLPGLESVDSFEDAVANLRNVIEQETEARKTLTATLDEKRTVRTAATDKVAGETVENDRMEDINNKFFQDYCKNEDEFPVESVDPQWRIVTFHVGENSGLIAGDTCPMLVRRGNQAVIALRIVSISSTGEVVAQYQLEDLPRGVRIQIGDKVFRQKPVGN